MPGALDCVYPLTPYSKRGSMASTRGGSPAAPSSAAYLTQAVQSRVFPAPLVAREKALLRVFLTRTGEHGCGAFRRSRHASTGTEGKRMWWRYRANQLPSPTKVQEGDLAKSANAEIPGAVVQPGLEMVIEIDPKGTLDSALGVARRIPEEGRLEVEVQAMPLFDLTLIPFVRTETHDSTIVDLVKAMAADPDDHEMLADMHSLLPVEEVAVTAHDPVLSSNDNGFRPSQADPGHPGSGGRHWTLHGYDAESEWPCVGRGLPTWTIQLRGTTRRRHRPRTRT